jgi:hypothetical protein
MNDQDFSVFCKNYRRGVFYQVHREHIKEFGAEKAVFFSIISDHYNSIKKHRKWEKETSFTLSVREMASLTGLSLFKVKECIKFWESRNFLLSKSKDSYQIRGDLK